jgi:hypothetical protein
MRDPSIWLSCSAVLFFLAACATEAASPPAIQLLSRAFQNGGPIPVRHTCQGEDLSPDLSWTGVPPGTLSLALICEDPDAPLGTWVHWVLYDMLPYETGLGEGVGPTPRLPNTALQGVNSWKKTGYGGPCPPPGNAHRYFFRLYALDCKLGLSPGATRAQLLEAMKGHVLGQGEIMGTYRRR